MKSPWKYKDDDEIKDDVDYTFRSVHEKYTSWLYVCVQKRIFSCSCESTSLSYESIAFCTSQYLILANPCVIPMLKLSVASMSVAYSFGVHGKG